MIAYFSYSLIYAIIIYSARRDCLICHWIRSNIFKPHRFRKER